MRDSATVRLKTPGEIDAMAAAGRVAALTIQALKAAVAPGVNLLELEQLAKDTMKGHGARPGLLNYHPGFSPVVYRYATCLSLNDEVIHAEPRDYKLKENDVIGLDLVAELDGWFADTAWTALVGEGAPVARKLLNVTEKSMWLGIEQCRAGNTLGHIGGAVQRHVEKNGFHVLREMVGHGVGTAVHEGGLDVANFGRPGSGRRLEVGMTFAVEPMVSTRSGKVKHRKGDPWAVVTTDGGLGAHFEHTVAVTADGPRVLTLVG
ncbi:type I methionyl aminopeptidase [bacterium]|nr:MAG: type I methionyl aminopeptidase [bacterium]